MAQFIFLILEICTIYQTYSLNYPNCLDNYPVTQTSNNFNRNFIELTQFLFSQEDDSLQEAARQILLGQNEDALTTFMVKNRTNYLILIITIAVFCAVIFVVRTAFSKTNCILKFTDRDISKILNPCLVIMSVMVFSLSILTSIISTQIQNNYDSTLCTLEEITSLLDQGDNSWEWNGISGYIKRINNHIQLLKTIDLMPNSYNQSVKLMQNKIKQNYNFPENLYSMYSDGIVQFDGEVISFRQILPEFFSNNQTLNLLNQSIMIMTKITQTAINSQLSIIAAQQSAADAVSSLQSNKKYMQMEEKQFKSLFQLFLDQQKVFNSIQETSWLLFANKFFMTLSLITSASYVILIMISSNKNERIYDRLADLTWFIFILLIIVGLFLLYSLFQLATKQTGNCKLFQKIKNSEQIYSNITISSNSRQNIYLILYPCLFGDGEFEDIAFTGNSQPVLLYVFGNFTHYRNIMNIGHAQYHDAFRFRLTFIQAIQTIVKEQVNMRQSWPYMTNLLIQLNQVTYSDQTAQQCYKHKWAFNRQGCSGIDKIFQSSNNNLLVEGDINSAQEQCLLFYQQEIPGQPTKFLGFSQFWSNYASDSDNSYKNCQVALAKVEQIGKKIINAAHTKADYLEGIKNDLIQEQIKLTNWLKILRTNYLKKMQQYEYISTLSNRIQFGKQSQKLWRDAYILQNNCSVIRDKIEAIFSIFCLNLRAGILKFYIITTMIVVSVSVIVMLGLQYGFYKQSYAANRFQDEQTDQDSEQFDSQSIKSSYIETKKYMHQFFQKSKKRK